MKLKTLIIALFLVASTLAQAMDATAETGRPDMLLIQIVLTEPSYPVNKPPQPGPFHSGSRS